MIFPYDVMHCGRSLPIVQPFNIIALHHIYAENRH
jgi:hypothetical protein